MLGVGLLMAPWPREGVQPVHFGRQHRRTLQQLPAGCWTTTLEYPIFSCPKWLQDALPVRASLLTAFICREISSFMAAKFSRLVEMTSLILSNSLLMKGNSETALFRVEQWCSKVFLQERKNTRCLFINYFINKTWELD